MPLGDSAPRIPSAKCDEQPGESEEPKSLHDAPLLHLCWPLQSQLLRALRPSGRPPDGPALVVNQTLVARDSSLRHLPVRMHKVFSLLAATIPRSENEMWSGQQ